MNCFYKQSDYIDNINKLHNSNASDVYIAVLYFDTCIFQEERGKATFLINREEVGKKKSQLEKTERIRKQY